MSIFRKLRAWWTLLELGSGMNIGRNMEEFYRYNLYQALSEEGLLDYLKEPRTYGEIMAHFGYIDSEYVRELFEVLANDARYDVIVSENNQYRLNGAPPTLEEILARTDERHRGFTYLSQDMVRNIPFRLRGQPVEFTETFESEGREMMQNFDELLSLRFYTVSRNAAFAFLTRSEREWLRGKKMLEAGCGSGRETAELWLHLNGDIHITAIDPVTSMVERAEKRFPTLLDEIDPDHPPLTDTNRPVFQEASVTQLPWDDNSFDAVFQTYILHWTSNPRRAIREMVRVVRPDGVVFGCQNIKPYWSPIIDIVMRSNENSYGFFWREEQRAWYAENGFDCESITPLGIFRARRIQ